MSIEQLRAPLSAVGVDAWIVGGSVRDAIAGRPIADIDIAIDGDAGAAAARLARVHKAHRFPLSSEFGAWRLSGGTLPAQIDITPLQGADVFSDLRLRDLTINAMAVAVTGAGELIDPHGGLADLVAGRLRMVAPDAFMRDPVRILRVARLAEQLRCTITPETISAARAAAPEIWSKACERLRDELYRMMALPRAWQAIMHLDALGGLGAMIPELEQCRGLDQSDYHHKDVLGHTIEVVEHICAIRADPERIFRAHGHVVAEVLGERLADDLSRGEVCALSGLLHDMAKPVTRDQLPNGRVTFFAHDRIGAQQADHLLTRLHAAHRVHDAVVMCVAQHLQLGFLVHRQPLSVRTIDRYLQATARAPVEMIVLTVADRLATRGPRSAQSQIDRHLDLARQMMQAYLEVRARGVIPSPIPGDVLAARLGHAPGPWLGEVIEVIRVAQLAGPITEQRALRLAEEWMRAHPDRIGAR